ncbi:HXXEE domain-containing protein [Elizabethkingia anophelis]|uniref:HXXEE domain-containing protein n=1 Tax=Elizabethkingia anophelis TaxID=1117645 RepID=UPI0020B34259|nr:HXXEE domain-containing protein [Elizabethkingia anophelis]MCT4306151.1 HXXEE domain-containing protein [Elizabethkingia anophelis]MDV3831808.1 hypothetical protein [Elizabethkingia anophelis]UTF95118.1 HXXEE domain-containing protein [Elizabethkingia anophelis]
METINFNPQNIIFGNKKITQRDMIVASLITVVMGSFFIYLSHGKSLLITFLPGLACAWSMYLLMFIKKIAIPNTESFTPIFLIALATQFLHFAEEHATGFIYFFGVHYGGLPYDDNIFTSFNMVSYSLFTLGYVLGMYWNLRFLLIPVFFFICSGVLGNAIWHVLWVLETGQYQPGFYTAILYWILAPYLLYKILGKKKYVILVISALVIVLIPLLLIFSTK